MDEAERLAWLVLQTVNRTQARCSTVRIIVPRDLEVADELGRELGIAPSDEELQLAEEHLLERGYIAPVDIGLTKSTYTITSAGMGWLERGFLKQPAVSHGNELGNEQEPSTGSSAAEDEHENLRRRLELAELAESRLQEERDRLVRELEKERDERMMLEEELARACRGGWKKIFGS